MTEPSSNTRTIAAFVAGIRQRALPPEVLDAARLCLADWIGVAVLSCLGAGLCLVLWRTASLVPCIMLHSFHNSISFAETKGLPWWGFLLLIAGSVLTALAIALLAMRAARPIRPSPGPA